MLNNENAFKPGNYKKCQDVFVLMGDCTPVPVVGYDTARIKLEGHVSCLENCLHVPSLETSLFSTTKHGRNGTGHSFLLALSEMHLTFPTFSVTCPIPEDGDLRLDLDDLTDNDWGIPEHICNGKENDASHLDDFRNRLYFLNQIFKGHTVTHLQRKE